VPKIWFDEHRAGRYDADSADMFDPAVVEPTVAFLAPLATDGHALEFAIGTGRIAVPLQQRGVAVHGIDLSPAMVEQLKAKPGGASIDVTIGDIATTRIGTTCSLVYLVFNTIMNLTTQDAQVQCFQNAAAHLAPGGCFVIEVGVPDLRRLPPGETMQVFDRSPTHVGIDAYTDLVAQHMSSHHYSFTDGQVDTFSMPFRYVWPSELDLMARLAGLTLRERWSTWDRDPFTSDSTSHVSVWHKPQ
jgi:SAM-dependent methyltransferase